MGGGGEEWWGERGARRKLNMCSIEYYIQRRNGIMISQRKMALVQKNLKWEI